jgi:glutathione S-transferase
MGGGNSTMKAGKSTMGGGTIYVDYLSQPCRALSLMCKLTGIQVTEKSVSLMTGEHKQEAFMKINPSGKVPAFKDADGWILTESVAIARYLCTTNNIPDNWYPKDAEKRARVDEFLSWYHTGIRSACLKVFMSVTFAKDSNNPASVKENAVALEAVLDQMENNFLQGRDYVAGDEISIADLFGHCELYQLLPVGYKIPEKKRPVLAAWIDRVKKATQPHFDQVSKTITEMEGKYTYDFDSL